MHGHVDAAMLASNVPFEDPASLLVIPDHYLVRMLISQGVSPELLGWHPEGVRGVQSEEQARGVWRKFCEGWPLFRGTPTRFWMEHVLFEVFGLTEPPSEKSADESFAHISDRLARADYRPRALFERFGIELLATTDPADSPLDSHEILAQDGWRDRVIPTFRPDSLLEPLRERWGSELDRLSTASGIDAREYDGYLAALRQRRRAFIAAGARATDHSHVVADTTPLLETEARRVFSAAQAGHASKAEGRAFTAHMLFQMAAMSTEDGLVMQLHHGILRDHDRGFARTFGGNAGFDIPVSMEFSRALRPMLEAFGHEPRFRTVVFTCDETTYSRELAPLAGAYPSLRLGAPWWFLDAPAAMRRFREATVETAGFYNTAGFVDDTRAFCSIPARHDLARRVDAGFLADLVAEHRLSLDEAIDTARALAYDLPVRAYPPLTETHS